jgi:hypothetical protein
MPIAEPPPSLADIELDRYDYIDLGSSSGGSFDWARGQLAHGDGVGVDLDPEKVRRARAAGRNVVVGDATDLRVTDAVRFITMFDFLEHLPSLAHVEAAIATAADAATDFIYIRHPSFEGQQYLESLGLRQYWWHWRGHLAQPTVADYRSMLKRLGLGDFIVVFNGQIMDSGHPSIHSVASPLDSHGFDPAIHPSKHFVRFQFPIWRMQRIYIFLKDLDQEATNNIIAAG